MPKKEAYKPKSDQLIIVGIGASAGGIEALTHFFEQVTVDSGLAYVVILHLSPDYDSQLTQIIQRVARIPVTQVTEKTQVDANQVYVVPPNKQLQMEDGMIVVLDHARLEDRRAPVDIFFRTLANSHGSYAIAVILSGTGANGSMGLKMVKEKGGAVFVQNPREAAFNEMPRHAIATELVDDILPVTQIPERLIAYKVGLGTVHIPEEAPKRPEDQQQALREVFTQLRLRTGHDFSNYKRSTLLRRLERRINIHGLTSLPAYAAYLREHIDETQALLKDLLISVTNFFRDDKVFTYLEENVMPQLTQLAQGKETLRIWVAGCATGEEAYSLAMLCAERTLSGIDTPKVQIFATDIDEDAIAIAREGLYTLNDAADVSAERLSRFFMKEGDSYRIRREIRESILFAPHNVLKDPPFSQLDLISCRNLFIYLNSVAQERVMETFHFALKPGGYLLLGLSETVDGSSDLYATVNREYHLYQSRQVASRPYPIPESIPQLSQPRKHAPNPSPELDGRSTTRLSFGDLHQQLLEQYAPPSIIVNEQYDILHFTPRAGRYLHFAGGELSKNLLKLIRPELRLELRTALYQATQQQTNVDVQSLRIYTEDLKETINLHVRPVTGEGNPAHGFVLILFELVNDVINESTSIVTSIEPIARHLENELIRAKAQLRSSNEQHELQAEELKASNEELQAMNEELRSAAEELETGKEEMQSINEELTTVNQELKVKVEEASLFSNNLQNLINSTDIATLFLNRSFRVNLFTPAARQIFNLISSDLGRPLTDVTNFLDYAHLQADVEAVLETLQPIEREVKTTNGRVYITRVLPYRTAEDRINGVVLTFVDITERKAAMNALQASEEQFRLFVTASSDTIYKMSPDWRQMLNLQGRNFLADTDDPTTSWLERYIPFDDRPKVETTIQKAIQERQTFEMEHRVIRADGSIGWTFSRAVPVLDERGAIREWFGAASDITARKQAVEALRQSDERAAYLLQLSDALRSMTDMMAIHGVVTQSALTYFQADRCYYCEIKGDSVFIRQDAFQPNLPSVSGSYSLSDSPLFSDLSRKGEPIIVADVAMSDSLDEALRQLCIENHILAYINVPVLDDNQLVGNFCITQSTPRNWTDSEVELAREIAERTWAAVERACAESELRKSEEQKAFLLTLSDALRPLTDAVEIQYRAACVLGEFLGANRVGYAETQDNAKLVAVTRNYTKDVPSLEGVYRYTDYGPELLQEMQTGQTVVRANIAGDPTLTAAEKVAHEVLQLGATLNVPLVKQGRLVAILFVHYKQAHARLAEETELAEETAQRIWAAVEQARAEVALLESERHLAQVRSLMLLSQTEELAKTGSWEYHRPTDQLSWSAGMYALFGLEFGQPVQPDDYLRFALKSDQDNAQRLVSHLQEREGSLQLNLHIQVAEATKVIRIKADVLTEADQNRVMGVALDITDQLLAQQQIQQTAESLQAVLNASPASIGLLKAVREPASPHEIIDFRLAVGNDRLADFFGQPLEALLGQSAARFVSLLWAGETLNVLRQVYYAQEFRYEERELPTPDQDRWLAISVMRQDDGIVLTGLDITELKQAQAWQQTWIGELEESRHNVEALAALRASLSERTELLRSFSHDLRSNFGIIQGGLQIMGMASSESERAQMMEMVLRNVKQATGLLTDLLDLARLETNQQQRTIDLFDAAQLFHELGESFQPMARNQALALVLSGAKSLPVSNDRHLVYRMTQNLIINALKYTHTGTVTVLWGEVEDQWWFEIADTGPGLGIDLIERLNANRSVTSPSAQATSALSSTSPVSTAKPKASDQEQAVETQPEQRQADWVKLRGEGIGLRIVQELAQLLEARLDVRSEAGVGTQFRLYLPLRYSQ